MPIKLLHEAEGHVVTVELKSGETYRGMLEESEDTMNCRLTEGEPHYHCDATVYNIIHSDNDSKEWPNLSAGTGVS